MWKSEAMPTQAETRNKNSRRALLRQAARTRAERNALIFNCLVKGLPHDVIARHVNCSVHVVRKIVARELAARRIEPAGDFAKLQIARLNEGLAAIHGRMLDGDMACVEQLLKVVAALDRYHGLAQFAERSGEFAGGRAALAASRRAAPAALPAPEQGEGQVGMRQICIPSL